MVPGHFSSFQLHIEVEVLLGPLSLSVHHVNMCDAAKLGKVEATADKFSRGASVGYVWWFWDRQLEANQLQKLWGLNLELDYLLLIRHNCLTHINCWVALNATTDDNFRLQLLQPLQ